MERRIEVKGINKYIKINFDLILKVNAEEGSEDFLKDTNITKAILEASLDLKEGEYVAVHKIEVCDNLQKEV